jgi:hypothetical protein
MTPTRKALHPSTLGPAGRARHTLVAAAVATALGVFSVPAMSADQADLQGLQDQINKLQREMDRMKAEKQTAPAPPAAAASKPASGAAAAPSFMAGPVKVTLGIELQWLDPLPELSQLRLDGVPPDRAPEPRVGPLPRSG